ncbi:MAG TPA: galactose oxidase-like domain-containing protein [bacterium]|nr:galactose oxidase-like domain-containing protein [bacterium]
MGAPVKFTPQAVNFGSVSPGSTGPPPGPPGENVDLSGGVFLDNAPPANVTAKLSDNTAGVFKIASVAVYHWVVIPLPPGPPQAPISPRFPVRGERVLELVAQSDGTSSLPVRQGQFVLVSIRYTAPKKGDAFGATLLIAGDAWSPNPVQIPLSLSLGEIATHLGATLLTIPQGGSGDLPIVVQSLAGPDTDVTYTLDTGPGPQGVSLQPTTVHVPRGASVNASLHFTVTANAPVVSNQTLWIMRTAFGGSLQNNPIENEPSITIDPARMAYWSSPFEPEASFGEPDKSKWTLAVHAALLPVGEGILGSILYFSGNRWDANNHDAGMVNHTVLVNYQSQAVTRPGTPRGPGGLAQNEFFDLFCSGHSLLADGRLLVAGGTSMMSIPTSSNPHAGHWGGLREAWIFDPAATPSWVSIAPMNYAPQSYTPGKTKQGGGRWYPSLLTLGDGSVIAMCGHPRIYSATAKFKGVPIDQYSAPPGSSFPPPFSVLPWDDERHNNNTPEVFSLVTGAWTLLDALGEGLNPNMAVFYPRLHVLPSGKILIVQPLYSDVASQENTLAFAMRSLIYDASSQAVTASFPGPQNSEEDYLNSNTLAQYTSSVLLPLLPDDKYRVRILLCGGEQALITTLQAGAESSASWQVTNPRQVKGKRNHCNATLLPTGEVFVNGGMKDPALSGPGTDATNGQQVPEIFDPSTTTWRALNDAPARVPRGYHSVALLMADGRVWTAGSEVNNTFGAPSSEFRIEVFNPDYIAECDRLVISLAPSKIGYGETFTVSFQLSLGSAGQVESRFHSISRVAVIRVGSVTHGFNYDQRYVALAFETTTAATLGSPVGYLRVQSPPNGNIAAPGNYMLWLLDDGGRPSLYATFLRIGG